VAKKPCTKQAIGIRTLGGHHARDSRLGCTTSYCRILYICIGSCCHDHDGSGWL